MYFYNTLGLIFMEACFLFFTVYNRQLNVKLKFKELHIYLFILTKTIKMSENALKIYYIFNNKQKFKS